MVALGMQESGRPTSRSSHSPSTGPNKSVSLADQNRDQLYTSEEGDQKDLHCQRRCGGELRRTIERVAELKSAVDLPTQESSQSQWRDEKVRSTTKFQQFTSALSQNKICALPNLGIKKMLD
jgi:hypothetical protein